MPISVWHISASKALTLDRPRIVGILNLTPDSFSDGGSYPRTEDAVRAAAQALADGADLLDLGGESTRPGAARVGDEEQIRRVAPVLRGIRQAGAGLDRIPITVDTTRAAVADAAIKAGADAINDVSAGCEDPEMLALAARAGCGLILMHRLHAPGRDSYSDRYTEPPRYADVVETVGSFLQQRAAAAMSAGVRRESIVVDPGLGFGKTVEQNLDLIRRSGQIAALGFPLMSGLSRKSFVGRAMGLDDSTPDQRLPGSIALSVAHLAAGAHLFRVHDVGPHAKALRAAAAALGRADA